MIRFCSKIFFGLLLCPVFLFSQTLTNKVNVFLGSSGDHGQLTPAASSPFSQLSILPQTYPTLHSGYEYSAKEVLGFTHNRFEGVGCKGSGGLILIKPFLGKSDDGLPLIKVNDSASPGNYNINFDNQTSIKVAVNEDVGIYDFGLKKGDKGVTIDFSHSFNRAFVAEEHHIDGKVIKGWVKSKTTCGIGIYTIFYAVSLEKVLDITEPAKHQLTVNFAKEDTNVKLKISFSAVNTDYAVSKLLQNNRSLAEIEKQSKNGWESFLGKIKVKGDEDREKLFYSLLYRTLQSPYKISEADGKYRGTDGKLHHASSSRYHGWAVWDNYKTQLPLLAMLYPNQYQDMVYSLEDLYRYGKFDFAGPNEPANSVRTEHSAIVLLDALNKGFKVNVNAIIDSIVADTAKFDLTKPDKYLEASYDMWAIAKFYEKEKQKDKSAEFFKNAAAYSSKWIKEFKDVSKNDVDRMSARNMYQGTIRQYRWSVPFDVKGLIALAGGKDEFTAQLDDFFDNNYFNRANEPDMQSQMLYYASNKPWKYQKLVHQLAVDTVIQFYFNDNSRGIDAHIDRIYKNEPKAYIRTMDDDAGAMSGWFVLTAIGLQQPLIGEPVYYLNVPLFPFIEINNGSNKLTITVNNFNDRNNYISGVTLNGKKLDRLWLTHDEISKGGKLTINAAAEPSSYGTQNIWVSSLM